MSSSLQLTYHNICTFLFNIYCTYLSITYYFDAVEAELSKRSTKLGRNDRYNAPKAKRPPTAFRLGDITENYNNPIRQVEYLYSLIESEVI